MVINRSDISTAYTNLTGRLPCKSSSGNEYVLVAYHYDGNTIIGCPLKYRRAETITVTWQFMHNMFAQADSAPNTYVTDNEISAEFTAALTKNNTSYQLVPPHIHRRNLAERAIQTYENHL